jgi:phage-related protein
LSQHGGGVFCLYKIWDNGVKPVVWLGDSLARVRDFAPDAKHETGVQLGFVQAGDEPSDWKPMPSVGIGVSEIRVRIGAAFRLIYMAKFAEAVYVLHAFQKKSRKTARKDIDLARLRFRALVRERKQR